MNCSEGAGTRSLLANVVNCTLGDNSSVGRNNYWPFEFALEGFNNLFTNFLESSERSEGNADKHVLGNSASVLFVFNLLDGVDEETLKVSREVGVGELELLECLGEFFFEFGDFSVALLDDLSSC